MSSSREDRLELLPNKFPRRAHTPTPRGQLLGARGAASSSSRSVRVLISCASRPMNFFASSPTLVPSSVLFSTSRGSN